MKNLKAVYLFIFALLPHFAKSSTEQPRLDCPSGKIEVEEDAAAVLPCSVHPQIDVTKHMVDWWRVDQDKPVFCSQYGGHECNPDLYKSKRITVNLQHLSKGNLTLQIHRAQLNDTGVYKCHVQDFQSSCKVELSVREKGALRRDGFSATATPLHKESEAPGSGSSNGTDSTQHIDAQEGAANDEIRHHWYLFIPFGAAVFSIIVLTCMKRRPKMALKWKKTPENSKKSNV